MRYCEGGSANGDLPDLVGSMGELTAVASAKRAVLGDFNDGVVLIDSVVVVVDVEESSEADRARTAYCTFVF